MGEGEREKPARATSKVIDIAEEKIKEYIKLSLETVGYELDVDVAMKGEEEFDDYKNCIDSGNVSGEYD